MSTVKTHCDESRKWVPIFCQIDSILLKNRRKVQAHWVDIGRGVDQSHLLISNCREYGGVFVENIGGKIETLWRLLFWKIDFFHIYYPIFLSSQQYSNTISLGYSIDRSCPDDNFTHMAVFLFLYRHCGSHTGIALGLRIGQMIAAVSVNSKGFSRKWRYTFFAWFLMLAILFEPVEKIFKILITLTIKAVRAMLIVRMFALGFGSLHNPTGSSHAFKTFHIGWMRAFNFLLPHILLLHFLFVLKLRRQTVEASALLPMIALLRAEVHRFLLLSVLGQICVLIRCKEESIFK